MAAVINIVTAHHGKTLGHMLPLYLTKTVRGLSVSHVKSRIGLLLVADAASAVRKAVAPSCSSRVNKLPRPLPMLFVVFLYTAFWIGSLILSNRMGILLKSRFNLSRSRVERMEWVGAFIILGIFITVGIIAFRVDADTLKTVIYRFFYRTDFRSVIRMISWPAVLCGLAGVFLLASPGPVNSVKRWVVIGAFLPGALLAGNQYDFFLTRYSVVSLIPVLTLGVTCFLVWLSERFPGKRLAVAGLIELLPAGAKLLRNEDAAVDGWNGRRLTLSFELEGRAWMMEALLVQRGAYVHRVHLHASEDHAAHYLPE